MTVEGGTGAMFSINHYCLIVTDLERSLAFYRDVMGMSLRSRVTRREDIATAIARPGITMHNAILYFADAPYPALELISVPAARGQGGPADPQSRHLPHRLRGGRHPVTPR